jgi:hypothetical protein
VQHPGIRSPAGLGHLPGSPPPRETAHAVLRVTTASKPSALRALSHRLQPFKTWQQAVRLTNPAASALPRTCIFCTATEGFPFAPSAQRARTEAGWRYRELATAHYAMITAPRQLTQMLLEVVWPLHLDPIHTMLVPELLHSIGGGEPTEATRPACRREGWVYPRTGCASLSSLVISSVPARNRHSQQSKRR